MLALLAHTGWRAVCSVVAYPSGYLVAQYIELLGLEVDAGDASRLGHHRERAHERIARALWWEPDNPTWSHVAGAIAILDALEKQPAAGESGQQHKPAIYTRAALAHRPTYPDTWINLAYHEGLILASPAAFNDHLARAFEAGLMAQSVRLIALQLIPGNWVALSPENRRRAAALLMTSLDEDRAATQQALGAAGIGFTWCVIAGIEPLLAGHAPEICALH